MVVNGGRHIQADLTRKNKISVWACLVLFSFKKKLSPNKQMLSLTCLEDTGGKHLHSFSTRTLDGDEW